MQHTVETLFSRWNLAEVRISGMEIWACCPFHGESKPSFSVNIESGKWHCFSCHESGTELKHLVAKMEGIPLGEADGLLEDYGIDTLAMLKEELRTLFHLTVAKRLNPRKQYDLTADDSWKNYRDTIAPYMLERGFTKETLLKHRVGYDKVRRLVIIPLFEGDVCRFAYTRIAWKRKSKKPNYDYPRNVDRGDYLWGIDKPEHEFHGKPLYVTEGAFDALWLRQNGYENTVAILGSYLTKVQQQKLENLCPSEVVFCFDNDDAGYNATVFAGRLLLKAGFRSVYYLPYPKGQNDPVGIPRKRLTRMVARKKSVRQLVWDNPVNKKTRKVEHKPLRSSRLERLLAE